MKKRIFLFSILSLAIATTVGVASASPSINSKNTIINQRSEGSATVKESFSVPKGWGHVKLRMKNHSDHPVKVSLTHSGSNKLYIEGLVIAPHDTVTWKSTDQGFSDGLRSGDYILQWRGSDYKVNGETWGVADSQPGSL
ncbi:hypothetical protein GMA19_02688 [Paenibacillus polymyxa E681]|uniref:hypothetical protein n=1 Tax=Paenibacillus polymyxa TaxID=1406 RepID=UPI0001E31FF2|nr:hypothetical protein [Paenibacillus polymyxa]ADM70491.1 hypothetical protein PPE_02663 [Paenibacillus polymyxa E681]QNV57518.1 hypothetical protein GE561_02688 [Paenibacillus polymyxa E681]QNV62355.1 hypothetical protein GMA19_02688 [Paenibacillus polymyxa E681]